MLWPSPPVTFPETIIIKPSIDTGLVVILLLVWVVGAGHGSAKLDGPWEGSAVLGIGVG